MTVGHAYEVWHYKRQERRQQHEVQHFLALTLVAIDPLHKFILVCSQFKVVP